MSKQTWTVKGQIMFSPQFSETREQYGDTVALPGVRVQVSAKESKLDPTWNEWADVHVDQQGQFSFTKQKDKTPRYFRVRVMFKDGGLKLYEPSDGLMAKLGEALTQFTPVHDLKEDALEIMLNQTTRLTYNVKWFNVLKDNDKSRRRGPGTVDFGNLVFKAGGQRDLSNRNARRHADIWWLTKKMTALLNSINCGFEKKRPAAFIHPFNSPLIGDGVESSYANMATGTVHLIENSRTDHFNASSVAHELMHLWAYQVSTGELGMAWQLLVHGSTHEGRQAKSWVAFHEGFAEWASNLLYSEIYSRPATIYDKEDPQTGVKLDNRAKPFSRRLLRNFDINSLNDIDHFELGWITLFSSVVSSLLDNVDPESEDTWMATPGMKKLWTAGYMEGRSDQPGLADVLRAFKATPSKGYPKTLSIKEMNRSDFLQRLVDTSPNMTTARRNLIEQLLNTSTRRSVPLNKVPKQKPELRPLKSQKQKVN